MEFLVPNPNNYLLLKHKKSKTENNINNLYWTNGAIDEFWQDFPEEFKLSKYLISNYGNIMVKETRSVLKVKPKPEGFRETKLLTDDDIKNHLHFIN
jgi:hypothetical protein